MISEKPRSSLNLILPWLLGVFFGLVILGNLASRITFQDKAEEFALGKETSTYWATDGEIPIHCSTPNDGNLCIDAYLESSLQHEIVLVKFFHDILIYCRILFQCASPRCATSIKITECNKSYFLTRRFTFSAEIYIHIECPKQFK